MTQHEVSEDPPLPSVSIGTAGWTVPSEYAHHFPEAGTHLTRYAQRFCGVEINSSFYRPHRHATYARWAASVPEGFRFAVKVPKEITHQRKLVDPITPLERFLAEVSGLEAHLGTLLIQLPPSLAFDAPIVEAFFNCLRARFTRQYRL